MHDSKIYEITAPWWCVGYFLFETSGHKRTDFEVLFTGPMRLEMFQDWLLWLAFIRIFIINCGSLLTCQCYWCMLIDTIQFCNMLLHRVMLVCHCYALLLSIGFSFFFFLFFPIFFSLLVFQLGRVCTVFDWICNEIFALVKSLLHSIAENLPFCSQKWHTCFGLLG